MDTPIAIQLRDYDEQLRSLVDNSLLRQSEFDLVSVPYTWFGELVERGALLPLDGLMSADSMTDHLDFYPVAWEAGQFKDQLYAVPFEVGAELLCYRKSVLEQQGLSPPKSLDDIIRIAREVTDPARQFYGIAWCGKQGTPLAQTFLQLLADFDQPSLNFPRHLGHVNLNVPDDFMLAACFDTDAAFRAAEFLRDLVPFSPPDVLDMGWDERLFAYANGRAAMAYNWSVRVGELHFSPGSPMSDTGFLAHPGHGPKPGISPFGGFGLAIPANLTPDRIEGAWKMLRWFTSPEVSKLAALNGSSSSPRISVSRDPDVADSSPVIGVIDRLARSDLVQRWSNPPIRHYSLMLKILGTEIHEMLSGRKTITEALAASQMAIETSLRMG